MHSLARRTHYCSAGWTRVGSLHARIVHPTVQARPMKHMSTLCDDILDGDFMDLNDDVLDNDILDGTFRFRKGLRHAYRASSVRAGSSWYAEFPRCNTFADCPKLCLCVVGGVLNHTDGCRTDGWPGKAMVEKKIFSSMCADEADHL